MSEGTALNSVLTPLPMVGAWATGVTINVTDENQIVFRVSYAPNAQAVNPAVLLDVQWSNDRTRWSSCMVAQEAAFVAGQDSLDAIVHRMFQFGVDPTASIDQALLPFDCSKWAYCRVRAKEVGDTAKPGAFSVQFESSAIHQVTGLIQPFAFVSRLSGFVVGPGLSTDGALARWSGVGGTVLKNSAVTISDDGEMVVLGSMHVVHLAEFADDHAVEIELNAAGFGDVKATEIDYTTGALSSGSEAAVMLLNIDQSGALGGTIAALHVLVTPGGADRVFSLLCGVGCAPIAQISGSFVDADSILNKAVDVTAALASGGAGNISVFVDNTDTMTIGAAVRFQEIDIFLDTGASGGGISPVFEFSTGVGTWQAFTPVDGTDGFKHNGIIEHLLAEIPTWAVGAGGDFLIRITRDRMTLSTTPIVDQVQIAVGVLYDWDSSGNLTINDINLSGPDPTITATGSATDIDVKVATKGAGRFSANGAALVLERYGTAIGGFAVTGNLLLVADSAYFFYVGHLLCDVTIEFVKLHVTTPAAGTVECELGVFTGDAAPDGSTVTLTKSWVVSDGSLNDFTTAGIRGNTVANTIKTLANSHVYVGFRPNFGTTQPTVRPSYMKDGLIGVHTKEATSGDLDTGGPFTGAVLGIASSATGFEVFVKAV